MTDTNAEGKAKRHSKCTVKNGNVARACYALEDSCAGYSADNKKGIVTGTFVNTKTGKLSRHFWAVKSGKYAKTGIMLNFCPFCGKDFRP